MINNMSLERFRQILGYNPYHFYGLSNSISPITSGCNRLVYEYGWQGIDAGGRQDIREAIATAEARLLEHLGYRVGSQWVEKELQFPRPYEAGLQYVGNGDVNGRWLSMKIGEGYIQEIGQKTYTTISLTGAVVYADSYGDGIDDTATITVSLTGLDPQPTVSEIAVFFKESDRLDGDGVENYEIRPIKASISGTTLTIIARSWLLVRPIKRQGVALPPLDPNDTGAGPAIFAQEVEIYRRYTKPDGITTADSQAVMIWESNPPPWSCPTADLTYDNIHDPYSVAQAIGRVNIRDRYLGYLGPAWSSYNTTTGEFTARAWSAPQPDRVIIRYKAGADRDEIGSSLPGGNWDQVVARLAMTELTRRICACDSANRELWKWQTDLSQTGGNNDVSFQATSQEQLNNPMGTQRGAIYAWNQIKNLMLITASIT